jgi:ethanolamine ammonia-lyase large subunit
VGRPILAPYGRVKLAEEIGEALGPKLIINLIGERPGGDAIASRSLSAYLAYRLPDADTRAAAKAFSGSADVRYEYTVISNIYSAGLPPAAAGAQIAERASAILSHKAAGNRLERILAERGRSGAAA